MKKKKSKCGNKYLKYENIGIIIFIIFGVYCLFSLKQYITNIIGTWDNDSYQNYVQLVVMMITSVVLFIIVVYQHHVKFKHMTDMIDKLNDEIKNKNLIIEQLNDELYKNKLYDTVSHTWTKNMLIEYISQMFEKNIGEFTLADISCLNKEAEERFLLNGNFIKDKNVIFFKIKNLRYTILFINVCGYDADLDMKQLLTINTKCIKSETYNTKNYSVDEVINEFIGED